MLLSTGVPERSSALGTRAQAREEEFRLKFLRPLVHEERRNEPHRPPAGVIKQVLTEDDPGLDRLSESGLIGEQIPLDRVLKDPPRDLMQDEADLRGDEPGHAARMRTDAPNEIVACAVLVADPMPDWSTDEILAVHFRTHKAEGVLFPDALVRGAGACGLNVVVIPEKRLTEHAERSLAKPLSRLMKQIEALGKSVGAPWGKDQKSAALAAMIGLHGQRKGI